jgi:hypothetical protein
MPMFPTLFVSIGWIGHLGSGTVGSSVLAAAGMGMAWMGKCGDGEVGEMVCGERGRIVPPIRGKWCWE